MQVRAVIYHAEDVSEELYQEALTRVDTDTQTKVKKFYRREDACRTLIGSLLLRLLLNERGFAALSVPLAKTAEGKPYVVTRNRDDAIAFNITHDNSLIAVAFAPGVHRPPAFSLGIDVMKVQIPSRDTLDSFIEIFGEQLTDLEKAQLTPDVPSEDRKRRFYWTWTVKEAYTKALGLGLGFDFSRVEFDSINRQVKIDGEIPKGWRFTMFTVPDGLDLYEGVVAEFVGGDLTEVEDLSGEAAACLEISRATTIMRRAVEELPAV